MQISYCLWYIPWHWDLGSKQPYHAGSGCTHQVGLRHIPHAFILFHLIVTSVCCFHFYGRVYSMLAPPYNWEHVVFGVLFFPYFSLDNGLQLLSCCCQGHDFLVFCFLFYGCLVFCGIYVAHFPFLIHCWWVPRLISRICHCK